MGEGGVITTNNKKIYEKMLLIRNHGMIRSAPDFQDNQAAFDEKGLPNPWYYEVHELGYNYRASAINCALGLESTK